jgi:hypothetical protein
MSNKNNVMRNIVIATPCYDGTVSTEYILSFMETVKLGILNGINFTPIIISGDSIIQRVRNNLVADFLKSNATDLIWVDSDQEWEPQWIINLVNYKKDVIGGSVVIKSEKERYNVVLDLNKLLPDKEGLIHLRSIGTGFLLMSRKVLKELWETSEAYSDASIKEDNTEKNSRAIFEIKVVDGQLVGEDILLCRKLQSLGYTIYLDPRITCGHIGRRKWIGDFNKLYSGRLEKYKKALDNEKRL